MQDTQLLRYSRHIFLDEIDIAGQEKLEQATVLIIGCGGLGNACAPILAASGIGHIILCDDDVIEMSNLQRQFAFTSKDIDQSKAEILAQYLAERNDSIKITVFNKRISQEFFLTTLINCDIVIDCTDNSKTRHLINKFSVRTKTPLISASVIQFSGQLMVFDLRQAYAPCYACLFLKTSDNLSCSENGVFSPLVHIIGAAQASEVIKMICGFGQSALGKVIQFEGLNFSSYQFKIEKDFDCSVCNH